MAHERPGFRFDGGPKGKRAKGHRPEHRPKRRQQSHVTDDVRDYCLAHRSEHVMKERIAVELGFREDQVAVALHVLNLEGLVGQPEHKAPHDSNREHMGYGGGGDSAWMGDLYYVKEED